MGKEDVGTSKFIFRKAVEDDYDAILALHTQGDTNFGRHALKQSFINPHFFCYVCCKEDKMVCIFLYTTY